MKPLELWGGVECTVNRVGEAWFDQLRLGGHHDREDDLDRIAALGIRTLRYPVLWERVAPAHPDRFDWAWTDRRLARLRALGISPIIGLVHHGSGPRYTHLLDPAFPEKLARFAAAVAERYPWVTAWTPVNEPATTARFAALYGHWFPHARDEALFLRALLQQCRGVVRAMDAIRAVVPDARLVQTDDTGRTYATPPLAYQGTYEDERRYLGFDLLCGRFGPDSPLWGRALELGASAEELLAFQDQRGPDVIGLNYYLTSDRLLDHALAAYPPHTHGGNGRHRYADVEAVRAWGPGITGHEAVLLAAWARYGRPLAVTEVCLDCSREEQVRWLAEAWNGALAAREKGADVRAVTAWSLFGAVDWDKLVVRTTGAYEPGAFDVRGPAPRPTAVARALQGLTTRGETPGDGAPGWWRRRVRLAYPPVGGAFEGAEGTGTPILVIGKNGTLGRAFERVCGTRGLACVLVSREEVELADADAIEGVLARVQPSAVINAAGYVRVDEAERDCWSCYRDNALGAGLLAGICAKLGLPLVTFSSDLVFDGALRRPYVESDTVGPLSVYGVTKAQAEVQVLRLHPAALVIRTSAFFGPWDDHNFVMGVLRVLGAGNTLEAPYDQIVSPTYVPDLVGATLDLLQDGERGVWHLANRGAVSWSELARIVATRAGLDPGAVHDVAGAAFAPAPRPAFSALASERAPLLPPLEVAIDDFFANWTPPARGWRGGCGSS